MSDTAACPTFFKPLLTFLPLPNMITVPVSCLTCHYTPCGSGNSFSSQYFCCSASWWGQVWFSVLCSNSSAPEFALISLWSHVLPWAEHKIWTQSILTSAATTRGLNWCEMIRITDLGRQNISETKWLKDSYQVHQKGRSDKGTGEKTTTLQVSQEGYREISVTMETIIAFNLYI